MIKQLSTPPPLAPPPPPPPAKNSSDDTTEASDSTILADKDKSLPATPVTPTPSTPKTPKTPITPSLSRTSTSSTMPSAARRAVDKRVLAAQIAGVFADVLVHRPKGAGTSKRAEEKIKGFLLGFMELDN
jgi:hypothetical protein